MFTLPEFSIFFMNYAIFLKLCEIAALHNMRWPVIVIIVIIIIIIIIHYYYHSTSK